MSIHNIEYNCIWIWPIDWPPDVYLNKFPFRDSGGVYDRIHIEIGQNKYSQPTLLTRQFNAIFMVFDTMYLIERIEEAKTHLTFMARYKMKSDFIFYQNKLSRRKKMLTYHVLVMPKEAWNGFMITGQSIIELKRAKKLFIFIEHFLAQANMKKKHIVWCMQK